MEQWLVPHHEEKEGKKQQPEDARLEHALMLLE